MDEELHPMSHVRIDFFSIGRNHYLYLVDIYSGWPICTQLRSTTTESIITVLREWYTTFGWPRRQISERDRLFNNETMASFCNDLNIIQKFNNANELTEIEVTKVRNLLKKCGQDWRAFEIALQELREVANPRTGLAPSKLFVARVCIHYQTKTSLNKKIENHNFLKIAESLTLTFYRGYNQELKNEYLNAIRFALNNEDIHYANRVLVDYSNWLMKKRKKYYARH